MTYVLLNTLEETGAVPQNQYIKISVDMNAHPEWDKEKLQTATR